MTGPLAGLDLGALAAFTAAAFVAVAGIVMVAGFLPRAEGPPAARGRLGGALVYAAAALLGLLVIALAAAAPALPWAVAVIAAGLAILGAPFAVQPLPAGFRESRGGLVAVLALSAAALAALPLA